MKTSKLLLGVGLVLLAVSNAQADPNRACDQGTNKCKSTNTSTAIVIVKIDPCKHGQCPSVGRDIQDKAKLLTMSTPVNVDEVVTSHVR